MDLHLETETSLKQQLDSIFPLIETRFRLLCPNLADNCLIIYSNTSEVFSFAKRYDYCPEIEANGFWTFGRLIIKFAKIALKSNFDEWTEKMIPISQLLITGLDLCLEFHHNDSKDLFRTTSDRFPHLLRVFETMSPKLHVIYGHYCSYWVRDYLLIC